MSGDMSTDSAGLITPLSRDTLQEQVHRQLCDLILDGRLAPGETITVQGLADAFGVSPMPVREALKRLTAASALTVVSGRSVGVAPLSRDRLADLHRVRMEIEPLAVAWGVARATDADIAEAERILVSLEAATAAGDRLGYLRGNRALHFALYRTSGSENLMRIIEGLWLQISPYFHNATYTAANLNHSDMVTAMKRRDAGAISAALRADIDTAYRILVARLDP